ncbi:hypothetical protein A0U92_13745 [Acetobacter aceti]|uniref:Uncharacterized protein n=1 Tax=Acetobacter aceti TaxID=435 RepID=A0A1U9KIV0_ACEAC|nr:hypothetical protein A0U92_13745 [Acetobacter aceti]
MSLILVFIKKFELKKFLLLTSLLLSLIRQQVGGDHLRSIEEILPWTIYLIQMSLLSGIPIQFHQAFYIVIFRRVMEALPSLNIVVSHWHFRMLVNLRLKVLYPSL